MKTTTTRRRIPDVTNCAHSWITLGGLVLRVWGGEKWLRSRGWLGGTHCWTSRNNTRLFIGWSTSNHIRCNSFHLRSLSYLWWNYSRWRVGFGHFCRRASLVTDLFIFVGDTLIKIVCSWFLESVQMTA